MRTTVTLDPDVEAAIEALCAERGIGRSEALNELVRRGLLLEERSAPYVHRSRPMHARVDVTNTGEVMDLLDQWDAEDRRRERAPDHT